MADPDVRARARLRRLHDSRILAGAIGLLALAVSLPFTTAELVLASSLIWIMVFVSNETRLVHRKATTPGHLMAGLVIVDRRRGGPPSTPRSFARALVLGLTLYVPPLWPFLSVSLLLMRFHHQGRSACTTSQAAPSSCRTSGSTRDSNASAPCACAWGRAG